VGSTLLRFAISSNEVGKGSYEVSLTKIAGGELFTQVASRALSMQKNNDFYCVGATSQDHGLLIGLNRFAPLHANNLVAVNHFADGDCGTYVILGVRWRCFHGRQRTQGGLANQMAELELLETKCCGFLQFAFRRGQILRGPP